MNWVILNNDVVELDFFQFKNNDSHNVNFYNKPVNYTCKFTVKNTDYHIKLIDDLFTISSTSNIFWMKWEDWCWSINGSIKIFNMSDTIDVELHVNHFDMTDKIPDECLSIIVDKKIINLLNGDNMESE